MGDFPFERDVTASVIHRTMIHRSKSVLVHESLNTPDFIAFTSSEASQQPARHGLTYRHITMQSFAAVLPPLTAPRSAQEVDEDRVRQDKGLPPLKQATGQNKRAVKRQRQRERYAAQGEAIRFFQLEDTMYAAAVDAWDTLSSIHEEQNAPSVQETPMGREFLRAREYTSPDLDCKHSGIGRWIDGVHGDVPEAASEILESDEDHFEEDAWIAEGIASGITRVTPVRNVHEDDLFLDIYPEYATNEEHWDALSSFHEESEEGSEQGSNMTNEVIAKADEVELPDSDSELENQEANQAFFESTELQSNLMHPALFSLAEYACTSQHSPQPLRSLLLASGF